MSVTFFVQQTFGPERIISCICGGAVSDVYPSYDAALVDYAAGILPVCGDEDCAYYRPSISTLPTEADAFDVNMAALNARGILEVLGLYNTDEDAYAQCGSATGEDLLGRILIAEAINPADEGTDSVQEGNTVFCGRPAGYTEYRLDALKSLAEYAAANSQGIAWS